MPPVASRFSFELADMPRNSPINAPAAAPIAGYSRLMPPVSGASAIDTPRPAAPPATPPLMDRPTVLPLLVLATTDEAPLTAAPIACAFAAAFSALVAATVRFLYTSTAAAALV